jgi:hypothetical protein
MTVVFGQGMVTERRSTHPATWPAVVGAIEVGGSSIRTGTRGWSDAETGCQGLYAISDGVPLVVTLDGVDQALEDIWDRAGDPAPI